MLEIPRIFFREEIRDDFCISEMMKRSWAAQLGILDAIKRLCDKYGLRYFADYGTLLGAVRHHGYVPWDDDLDISMPRKDFMIFLEHADEIDEGLVVRSFYNSETYMNFNAVVTHKADTLAWDQERTDRYYGCPFICYVDIFPWDYVPRDKEAFEIQAGMFGLACKLMYDLRNIEYALFDRRTISLKELSAPEFMKYKAVSELVGGCRELIGMLKEHNVLGAVNTETGKLRQQLCIAADTVAQMCAEEDADGVEYFTVYSGSYRGAPRRRKEWQETTVELSFEFGTIRVPVEYLSAVKSKYGEGYMKPVRFTGDHGYPFFRNEIRVLIGGDTGELLTDTPLQDPSVEAIPEEIRTCLLKEDGNLKRITLCGLSATDIINGGRPGLERIVAYLGQREAESDAVVFVFVPSGVLDFMDRCHLDMYPDYCHMLDQIGNMQNVILDDSPTTDMLWALISICDEYYGDECRLAEICKKYDVPMTIRAIGEC